MTYEEALQEFGLPASPEHSNDIRGLLVEAIEQEHGGKGQPEILRTLSVPPFSIGEAADVLLVWGGEELQFRHEMWARHPVSFWSGDGSNKGVFGGVSGSRGEPCA